jgi:hypothetical protein
MRSFVVALTAIAFLTMPAYSQGGRKHQPQDNVTTTEDKKPKVDEKDYKSALDRIPASEQKVDPWQNVRQPPKPK